MSWEMDKEKLRCFITLDDNVALMLTKGRGGEAYFRAFILENRSTGQIMMKFRHSYKDGTKNWYEGKAKDKVGEEAVTFLREAIETMLTIACIAVGVELKPGNVQAYFPPDDGGDFNKTVIWLEMQDLIEVSVK